MADAPRHRARTPPDVQDLPALVLQHRTAGRVAGQLPDHVGRQATAVVRVTGVGPVDAVVRARIVGVDVNEDLVCLA